MHQLKKIAGINLILMLVYSVIIQLAVQNTGGNGSYQGLGVALFSMFVIGAHVGINLIIALVFFFKNNNAQGKVFLLSSIILLLIGLSACFGNTMLTEVL